MRGGPIGRGEAGVQPVLRIRQRGVDHEARPRQPRSAHGDEERGLALDAALEIANSSRNEVVTRKHAERHEGNIPPSCPDIGGIAIARQRDRLAPVDSTRLHP